MERFTKYNTSTFVSIVDNRTLARLILSMIEKYEWDTSNGLDDD